MAILGCLGRGAVLAFCVFLLAFDVSFCYGDDKVVLEVVGVGECADCAENNLKTSQAFSGLRVTIDCKTSKGHFERRGVAKLSEEGKFTVSLPQEILKDGKLKEECYAQLHSASATPCPAQNGLDSSKIILKAKTAGKHTFTTAGKLKFSPVTCVSAFFWPHLKHPQLPPLPPLPDHPWLKHIPKSFLPPLKGFGHHFLPPPVYTKPLPPHVPVYEPPVTKPLPPPVPTYTPKPKPEPPVKKPCPPPVPVYKPKPEPPVTKPLPPPVPTYTPKPKPPTPTYTPKPKPPTPTYTPKPKPPTPTYTPKPKPPVHEPPTVKPHPPPVPIYKPKPEPPVHKPLPPPVPEYHKPLPPPIPTIPKKPCPPIPTIPPIPKIPSIPKIPDVPKFPPKYFHHPKIGAHPPLPPYSHP